MAGTIAHASEGTPMQARLWPPGCTQRIDVCARACMAGAVKWLLLAPVRGDTCEVACSLVGAGGQERLPCPFIHA